MANVKIAFTSNLKITLKKSIDSAYRKILCGQQGAGWWAPVPLAIVSDVMCFSPKYCGLSASEVVRDPVYQCGMSSRGWALSQSAG